MSAALLTSDAVPSFVHTLCPTCDTAFSAADSAFPHSLSCGHVVCADCATSMVTLPTPTCLLCRCEIKDIIVRDVALAAFADSVASEADDERPPLEKKRSICAESPRCLKHATRTVELWCVEDGALICSECTGAEHGGHELLCKVDLTLRLTAMQTTLLEGSQQLLGHVPKLQRARQRMVDQCSASVASFDAEVTALKAAIDAHAANTKASLQLELKLRLKAIDAQLEALNVSASQLQCGAGLCAATLRPASSATIADLAAVHDSVKRLQTLNAVYKGACVSTVCEVKSDSYRVRNELESLAALTLAVNQTSAFCRGDCTTFTHGVENVITVTLPPVNNGDVGLCAEDVVVWCASADDAHTPLPPSHVACTIDFPEPCVLQIRYTVAPSVTAFRMQATVRGCSIQALANTTVGHCITCTFGALRLHCMIIV